MPQVNEISWFLSVSGVFLLFFLMLFFINFSMSIFLKIPNKSSNFLFKFVSMI